MADTRNNATGKNEDKSANPATDKKSGVVKKIIGEVAEAAATGVFAGGVMSLIKNLMSHPDIHEAVKEKLVEILKGGRGRGDESVFFTSLVSLTGISLDDKLLFLKKHYEMNNPDFAGKSPEETQRLKLLYDRAKGLVFLMAEDKTANEKNPNERFIFANQLWYGIFLGITKCPDENSKMDLLEERIIHFGKNNQENITLGEAAKPVVGFVKNLFSEETSNDVARRIREAKLRRKARR